MLTHIRLLFAISMTCLLALSQQLPNILPLAVKSPYLNYYWGDKPSRPSMGWPMFWNSEVVGWSILARIDGDVYQLLGTLISSEGNVTTSDAITKRITPTRTIFTHNTGPVELTVTFLSPIERSDAVKQSMPFVYVAIDITFPDNSKHDVQVYMDITGEFVTSQDADPIMWNLTNSNQSIFFEVYRESTQQFEESNDRAQDLVSILGTVSGHGSRVLSSVSTDQANQGNFNKSGEVVGDTSIKPPAANGGTRGHLSFPVIRDLGKTSSTHFPVVFVFGLYRNPSVSVTTATGKIRQFHPLFLTKYGTIANAVDAFFADYANATARADELDQLIFNTIGQRSDSYRDLISLSARQTMATTELVVSEGSNGKWNTSDIQMFMKDIGDSHRVNPVEKLYLSFPFFLFINTTYAGQLLLPLFEAQSASPAQPYAQKDIGQKYPQADERFVEHQQQVEHTSSMLIMSLSHARYSGDGTLISNYYSLLQKWADYLVKSTMNPPDMTTIDGAPQTNSTNLVIKGIIAIKAMSVISNVTGRRDDSNRYSDVASEYLDDWISRLSFQDGESYLPAMLDRNTTWAKIYNLYADTLLGTGLIPTDIYDLQTRFYQSQSSSESGITENGTTNVINMATTLFAAAAISNVSIQDDVISPLWSYVLKEGSNQTMSVIYSDSGTAQSAPNSAALGAAFAPLVLDLRRTNIKTPKTTPSPQETVKHSIIGPVVGGLSGGLALIVVLVAVTLWRRRLHCQKRIRETLNLPQPFISQLSSARDRSQQDPHWLKTRDAIRHNTMSSSIPTSQTPDPFLQTVLPGPQSLPTDNTRLLVELSAELQALRREIRDGQRSDTFPPPSYVTRPVD